MGLVGTSGLSSTKISDLIRRLKKALYQGLDWDENRVMVRSTKSFVSRPQFEQFIYLHANVPIPAIDFEGAERVEIINERIIEIHLMTYLHLDNVEREEAALLDTTLGHYELEDDIVDILERRFLLDELQTKAITIEPIRMLPPFSRDKEMPFATNMPNEGKTRHIESILPYSIKYARPRTARTVEITNIT